ncbi:MAG: alkaline phosphatase family protein [Flavobacteriales bacterium]|nr:alkaline phosphatase family protein [Flavobacteriales bacterium]
MKHIVMSLFAVRRVGSTRSTFAVLTILTSCSTASAQSPTWQEPPRLVVGVVVDQMRTDYIYRYWHNFGTGGFRRILKEGAFLRDAHFDHAPTETGPGHASVYTGTSPSRHGIVANEMVLRPGGSLYCAGDVNVQGVGLEGVSGQRSPANLLATTLADELERRTARASRTIGIAMKDRGAILPIGRTGDAAYWFSGADNGAFISSTWYMDTLPAWVRAFNARDIAATYLQGTWDLLLPRERYQQVLPDANPYEIPAAGMTEATLPVDLAKLREAGGTGSIGYIPAGNTLTTDFALAALEAEGLGRDAVTDLLAVSYSSPDILGHRVGPRALELEDMYLRLDQELERLMNALDKQVGPGRWVLFLTADHAAPDVPQYLKDLKGSAGYIDVPKLKEDLNAALARRFGAGNYVRLIGNDQVFLNDSLLAARKLDRAEMQRVCAQAALRDPLVAEALTADDLTRLEYTDGVRRLLQRGFMPQRSGDVLLAFRPGYFEGWAPLQGRGTTHGSVWNYDTHVPVLFVGRGIRACEVLRRTSITDIAPTMAMLVGMPPPDASSGAVVTEVVAP